MRLYKWVAGRNWRVSTREGMKSVGSSVIPLWTAESPESVAPYYTLVNNNLGPDDETYLATFDIDYDPKMKTKAEYQTFEFDFTQDHPIGSQAMQKHGQEFLIMAPAKLVDLVLALPNDSWDQVFLYDRNSNPVDVIDI